VVMGQSSDAAQIRQQGHTVFASGDEIVTGKPGRIKVYSLSGSELISAPTGGRYKTNLERGLYLVIFRDLQGAVSNTKVLIH